MTPSPPDFATLTEADLWTRLCEVPIWGTRTQKARFKQALQAKDVTLADFVAGTYHPLTRDDLVTLARHVGY